MAMLALRYAVGLIFCFNFRLATALPHHHDPPRFRDTTYPKTQFLS